jgi:hypothetical protein
MIDLFKRGHSYRFRLGYMDHLSPPSASLLSSKANTTQQQP